MSGALPGALRSRALKLGALLGVAGLSAAACAPASNPPSVPIKQQGTVLVSVVDSLFDAGRSPSGQLDKDGHAIPGVTTSLALDGQGKHHVTWATPSGLFYSTDAGGAFSTPDKIIASASFGGSVAVGSDGTVWVSFYSGGSLRVAHRTGGTWAIDEVQKSAGPAATPATVTAIRLTTNGDPIVAYGDQGATKVATRSGGGWKTERIGALGGYGVSLALEKDGSPNVTYYDARGVIDIARPRGGSTV